MFSREYRKRVRVIDYRDADYLNTAMNETLENYERCLVGLGFPHNLTGEQGKDNPPRLEADLEADLEDLKSRSCGLIERYLSECQPVLARCLSAPSQELVRSREAAWLVERLTANIRRRQGGAQFHFTDCQVLGGKVVSSSSSPQFLQSLVSHGASLLSFLVVI